MGHGGFGTGTTHTQCPVVETGILRAGAVDITLLFIVLIIVTVLLLKLVTCASLPIIEIAAGYSPTLIVPIMLLFIVLITVTVLLLALQTNALSPVTAIPVG